MTTHAAMLTPTPHGWAITLTNGPELARFAGPAARRRALRDLTRTMIAEPRHAAQVRGTRSDGGGWLAGSSGRSRGPSAAGALGL